MNRYIVEDKYDEDNIRYWNEVDRSFHTEPKKVTLFKTMEKAGDVVRRIKKMTGNKFVSWRELIVESENIKETFTNL